MQNHNVTKQKTLSTATAAEKRALSDTDSRLSKSIKKQGARFRKKLEDANVSNLDKAGVLVVLVMTATDNGEENRANLNLLEKVTKPAPGANVGVKGGNISSRYCKHKTRYNQV